jgi:hypothetical protein
MNEPTIENLPVLTDDEVFALTDVYTSAGIMVRALASMKQGWSNHVSQVKAFQESWNDNIVMMRAWAGGPMTGVVAQVLDKGLVADGRYGLNTAAALGELIFLISSDYDEVAESVPVAAAGIVTWYAQYHSLIEGALMTNFSAVSTADPTTVTVNTEELADNTLDDSGGTSELPTDDMGSDITFDEPTVIVSTAKREGWNVPIWALGLGLVTAGTLFFVIAKRTKRRQPGTALVRRSAW